MARVERKPVGVWNEERRRGAVPAGRIAVDRLVALPLRAGVDVALFTGVYS